MADLTIGLCIGLPFIGRPVAPEWAISLAAQNYPLNTNVMFSALKGVPVDEARNRIVEHALEHRAKYLWFLDDDVAPPFWAARHLLFVLEQSDDDVMVAGGIYCVRSNPTEPIVYRGNGQGAFWKWRKDEVFECSGLGTGCMMIKTEVFQHLEKPYFCTFDNGNLNGDGDIVREQMTDDLWFCRKVTEAGYRILADGNVLPIHWDIKTGKHYILPEDSYPLRLTSGLEAITCDAA